MILPARSIALLTLATAVVAGCRADKHVFMSTPTTPTTIRVVDALTEQILWQKDIPVYCRLKLNFSGPGEMNPIQIANRPATAMGWKLQRPKTYPKFEVDGLLSSVTHPRRLWTDLKRYVPRNWQTAEKGSLALPGTPVKMKMSLRSSPEYPPEVWPAMDEAVEPVVPDPDPATTESALDPATTEPADMPSGEADPGDGELETEPPASDAGGTNS